MKTFSTTKFVKSHFKSENSKWTSANDSDNKECLAPIKQNVILPKRIPFFSLVDLYYKTLYSFIITSRKTVEIWLLSFYINNYVIYSILISKVKKNLLSGLLQKKFVNPYSG